MKNKSGQSVLEVILAAAVFMFFSASSIGLVLQALRSNRLGLEETIAAQYTVEGLEAVRSIKNQSFSNLNNTLGIGLSKTSDVWAFSGTENIFDNRFHRSVSIADVYRDTSGNIVSSGGVLDSLSKKVTVITNWNFTSVRQNSVMLSTYFSDWRKPFGRGGMLVYSDGGTSTDAIRYRTFDGSSWGSVGNLADIDSATTNRYLRSVRIFSSQTRNEKIVVSHHVDDSAGNYIYAQVFNGTSWGNVQLLASWTSFSYGDVQPFDGTYMSNGNFAVFYSDNTSTPKYRVWFGSSWSGQFSMPSAVGGIPNYIVAKARLNTKEIMVATFDQASDTYTYYFNGIDLSVSSNWTKTNHGLNAPMSTKRTVDFDWSPNNPSQGALVYSDAGNDRAINIKIFTANGSGGGSWSSTANSPNIGTGSNRLGSLSIGGRKGANEFIGCVKGSGNNVICFESNNTPTWITPSNNAIATSTQTGIQRSFHFGYENSGVDGLVVYSDNTAIAKAKKYNPATNTFNSTAINVGTLNGTVSTVRLIPNPASDDILVLAGSTGLSFYSVFWNGSSNSFYGSGDQGFMLQGSSGSNLTDYWYDFTWN